MWQFFARHDHDRPGGHRARLLAWLCARHCWLLVGIILGVLGCIAPLPYQPDERLVAELGLRPAQHRLRDILLRTSSPGIPAVDVSEAEVRYLWPPPQGTRIAFVDLTAVDIYPNHVVIMYGANRQVLGTVVCANEVDTQQLADLLMSFRARALRAAETGVPAAPARRPERVPVPRSPTRAGQEEIALQRVGNAYALPIEVNGELSVHFVLEPQAAEVSVAPALASNFYRTGLITEEDFLPGPAYRLPGGGTLPSEYFVFHSLKIGSQTLDNVTARVRQGTASCVVGQEALHRLGAWRVDAQRQMFIIEEARGRSWR